MEELIAMLGGGSGVGGGLLSSLFGGSAGGQPMNINPQAQQGGLLGDLGTRLRANSQSMAANPMLQAGLGMMGDRTAMGGMGGALSGMAGAQNAQDQQGMQQMMEMFRRRQGSGIPGGGVPMHPLGGLY